LLAACFELDELVTDAVVTPHLQPTWIELMPTESITAHSRDDLRRLDDWLALVETLREHRPDVLDGLGYPERNVPGIHRVIGSARVLESDEAAREQAVAVLRRLARVVGARVAFGVAEALEHPIQPASTGGSRTCPGSDPGHGPTGRWWRGSSTTCGPLPVDRRARRWEREASFPVRPPPSLPQP
jgi:hypothetical protein